MSPTRIPDTHLDAALRGLDAAPPAPLDQLARVRTDAALERVLAAGRREPSGHRRAGDPLLPRRRRTGLQAALLAAAAGTAVVGVASSQVLGGAGTAYAASWTPVPTAASAADAAAAQEACAGALASVSPDGAGDLEPRLVERRGDLVLLSADDGAAEPATAMCVVGLPAGGEATEIGASGGGGVARPAPDAVTDAGIYQQGTPGEELSVIDGLAGERVVAVTVHTADGQAVQATVQGGHYAAWWPGLAMGTSTEPLPSGVSGACEGDCDGTTPVPSYTLDVTLDDGTVLTGLSARGT